jgi:hypothetical protein
MSETTEFTMTTEFHGYTGALGGTGFHEFNAEFDGGAEVELFELPKESDDELFELPKESEEMAEEVPEEELRHSSVRSLCDHIDYTALPPSSGPPPLLDLRLPYGTVDGFSGGDTFFGVPDLFLLSSEDTADLTNIENSEWAHKNCYCDKCMDGMDDSSLHVAFCRCDNCSSALDPENHVAGCRCKQCCKTCGKHPPKCVCGHCSAEHGYRFNNKPHPVGCYCALCSGTHHPNNCVCGNCPHVAHCQCRRCIEDFRSHALSCFCDDCLSPVPDAPDMCRCTPCVSDLLCDTCLRRNNDIGSRLPAIRRHKSFSRVNRIAWNQQYYMDRFSRLALKGHREFMRNLVHTEPTTPNWSHRCTLDTTPEGVMLTAQLLITTDDARDDKFPADLPCHSHYHKSSN